MDYAHFASIAIEAAPIIKYKNANNILNIVGSFSNSEENKKS